MGKTKGKKDSAKKAEQRADKAAKQLKKAEKKSGEPKEKRTKKKKLTRLPGQPKKNQSAYFLWMNHNREQIKKDYPGLSMTDMTKKAGELWRDLQDKTVSRIIYQESLSQLNWYANSKLRFQLYYKYSIIRNGTIRLRKIRNGTKENLRNGNQKIRISRNSSQMDILKIK